MKIVHAVIRKLRSRARHPDGVRKVKKLLPFNSVKLSSKASTGDIETFLKSTQIWRQ